MMLTWMVSVASMVRKLVYEREIQIEEVNGFDIASGITGEDLGGGPPIRSPGLSLYSSFPLLSLLPRNIVFFWSCKDC